MKNFYPRTKIYLLIIGFLLLLLSDCSRLPSALTVPTSRFTPSVATSPAPTDTPPRPNTPTVFSSTNTFTLTATETPSAVNTLLFEEDFSNVQQGLDKFTLLCNPTIIKQVGYITFNLSIPVGPSNWQNCVIQPKQEYLSETSRVNRVEVTVRVRSPSYQNALVGFFSECGNTYIGFWVNSVKAIYATTDPLSNMTLASWENSHEPFPIIRTLIVEWGKQYIRASVEGMPSTIQTPSPTPAIIECSDYPFPLFFGISVDSGGSIIADIDDIKIYGEVGNR